jgi:hypothetical protein
MWQVSSPNQNWLTIDPITGLMSGTIPPSLAGLTIPIYLRAENCVGEDTIQIDLTVAKGLKLWKVWYGNAGEWPPLDGIYTQDNIFFLDNNNGGQNINNSAEVTIFRGYTIYATSSGQNEYQVFAIPKDAWNHDKTLVFTSSGFNLNLTLFQSDLLVQGVLCDVYRTGGKSAGSFIGSSQIIISSEG